VSATGIVAAVVLAVPATADPGRHESATAPDHRAQLDVTRPDGVPRLLLAEAAATPQLPATPPPPPTPCPVAGPVEFVDSWGFRRSGGRRHQGVDLLAAHGTPVVAPVAGTVTVRDNRTGGRSYHLVAADGTYYYGTHLAAYGATGAVEVGDVIGYVGDTGNAAGTPHLHLEIHPGGEGTEAVNPYGFVATWCAAERVPTPPSA
jgi:murein DD-endopeptidase MepM/ murein hydrolase activator NlpD